MSSLSEWTILLEARPASYAEWCESALGKSWLVMNAGRGLAPCSEVPPDRANMELHVGSRTSVEPPRRDEPGYSAWLSEVLADDPESILARDQLLEFARAQDRTMGYDPWRRALTRR